MIRRPTILLGVVLGCSLAFSLGVTSANAQSAADYPNKSVRFVVPYPPAGATDIAARIVAQRLTEKWGQSVVVENKAGAGGNIGTDFVAKSAPDGYMILVGATSNISTNISLYEKLPFHPIRDFTPVSLVVTTPQVLVARPQLQASSVNELIALAKQQPGKFNYSTYGLGSLAQLTTELLKSAAGLDIVHVPYKGGGPAMMAVVAGEVQMTFATASVALPQVKGGKVRAIAVTSQQRYPALPDVPTFAELGYPALTAESWTAMVAPAGTPRAIVRKISDDVAAIVNSAELKKFFTDQGLIPVGSSPEETGKFIQSEIDRWAKVVKASGIRVE